MSEGAEMEVRLGIDTCFAVKRWPRPEDWAPIVADRLGLRLVEHSFDLVDPDDAAALEVEAGVAAIRRQRDLADVVVGLEAAPCELAPVRVDQAPVGAAAGQVIRVEVKAVPRLAVELVGARLRRRRLVRGVERERLLRAGRERVGLVDVQNAKTIGADGIDVPVHRKRVAARIEQHHRVAAETVGVGLRERARGDHRTRGPFERPVELAVVRQRVEDDARRRIDSERVAVGFARDVDRTLDIRDQARG